MSAIRQTLTILKRIAIVTGIAIAFTLGLIGAIYLSLRSSETRVPDVIGKDRASAENTISDAGLNFRVRATRATNEATPNTVLIQLPRAGEIVKVGQTVAVDISKPGKDGQPAAAPANTNAENANKAVSNAPAENSNANGNRRKPTNRNSNDNLNGNSNANRMANRNRNANANPNVTGNRNGNLAAPSPRGNVNAAATPARTNSNRNPANRRPPVPAPTP